jgi:hypothetical protein
VIVHTDRIPIEPPLSAIDPDPAVAPVIVPPQVLLRAGVEATTSPEGNVSVKATLLWNSDSTLLIVMVRVDVPLVFMRAGEKLFVRNGAALTMKVPDAVVPVPPFVDVTALVTLLKVPDDADATVVDTVQLAPPASEPPVRLKLLAREFPVAVPPHVLLVPGIRTFPIPPAGYVSLKAIPVSVMKLGLVMVIVRTELPRAPTGFAE